MQSSCLVMSAVLQCNPRCRLTCPDSTSREAEAAAARCSWALCSRTRPRRLACPEMHPQSAAVRVRVRVCSGGCRRVKATRIIMMFIKIHKAQTLASLNLVRVCVCFFVCARAHVRACSVCVCERACVRASVRGCERVSVQAFT